MSDPQGPRAPGGGDDDGWSVDPPSVEGTDHGEGAAGAAPAEAGGPGERPDPAGEGEQGWALGQTEWVAQPQRRDRRPMLLAFVVGVLAGMVVLGLVWATAEVGDDSGQASLAGETSTTTPATEGAQSQEPTVPGLPSRMHRCRQADEDLTGILQAAAPAMDQWEVHIGAMNKLVVGAITLQQATDFWNQTRVGAQRNLEHFRAEEGDVPFAGVDCPSPAALEEASTKLRACAERVARDRLALEAARTALGTWATHVRHMEMLRMGRMSAAQATRMWLASWRQGADELSAYRAAARETDASAEC
jgi:hypothetical protein